MTAMPSPGSIVTVTLEATVSRAVSNSAPKTFASAFASAR
jgi:hypothetical protein